MARRLFIARRTYRQNRLQDAARLLPIFGLGLIFAPIFIRDTDTIPADVDVTGMDVWLVYYFAVWVLLIVLTALVSRALVRVSPDAASDLAPGPSDPARPPPGGAS